MKKDKLLKAYEGMISDPHANEPTIDQPVTSDEPQELTREAMESELDLDKEQRAKLYALQTSKRGRPKGVRTGEGKERADRATFVISKDITRKLKYVALVETRLYKDVVAEALTQYIDQFEKENGTIKLK